MSEERQQVHTPTQTFSFLTFLCVLPTRRKFTVRIVVVVERKSNLSQIGEFASLLHPVTPSLQTLKPLLQQRTHAFNQFCRVRRLFDSIINLSLFGTDLHIGIDFLHQGGQDCRYSHPGICQCLYLYFLHLNNTHKQP